PAVESPVLTGDREAEARAPLRTCRVGAPEPVEDPEVLVAGQPDSEVADRQRRALVVLGNLDLDLRRTAVLGGVGEQVSHDPVDPSDVGLDDRRLVDANETYVDALALEQRVVGSLTG